MRQVFRVVLAMNYWLERFARETLAVTLSLALV